MLPPWSPKPHFLPLSLGPAGNPIASHQHGVLPSHFFKLHTSLSPLWSYFTPSPSLHPKAVWPKLLLKAGGSCFLMLPWHCGGGAAGTGAQRLLRELGCVLSITHTNPMPLAVQQSCASVTMKSQSQTEGFGLERTLKII